MSVLTGALPQHQYVSVDSQFCARGPRRWLSAVWFGLVSYPGRAWGCTVLLEESGAIYRNLPLHALSSRPLDTFDDWTVQQAQHWDCYGREFHAQVYPYLSGLRCRAKVAAGVSDGTYLFSVAPDNDAFSAAPDQSKEFTFIALDHGRYTTQPTDRVLFEDRSFTRNRDWVWPTDMIRQTDIYSAE